MGAYSSETISVTLGDFRAAAMGSIATTSGAVAAAGNAQIGSVGAATALNLQITGFATTITNTVSDGVSTVNAANSAIAKATAINQYTSSTGIKATANSTVYQGGAIAAHGALTLPTDSLKINGVEVMTTGVNWLANDTQGVLASRINLFSAQTGVSATYNASNQLVLTAADGRNIDVTVGGTLSAANTGLTAGTVAGSLTLTSNKGFAIAGGAATIGFNAATQSNIVVDTNKKVSMVDVTTQSGATTAIDIIDSALKQVSDAEASLGALSNRLTNTISNIQIANENLSAANSRIMDTDFASETANMTRAQIIQQSSVAVLTQANSRPQIALTLLKG